ncbi:MAG: hypothetical protein QM669_10930 [Siphonobacter sp.]
MTRILLTLLGSLLILNVCSSSLSAQSDPPKRLTLRQWRKQYQQAKVVNTTRLDTLSSCDTATYIPALVHSPWRLSIPFGPGVAYCGSFDGTFNHYRDKTLFNGVGLSLGIGADYFFNPAARFRFGLGGEFGYHRFFVRKGYKDYLYGLSDALGIPRSQVELRKRASEDFYFVVGPVITYNLSKKPVSSFIEASARAGIFRTEAALIGAIRPSTNEIIALASPTDKVWHPGVKGNLGIFFPFGNNWFGGVQAGGYYTRVNYFTITQDGHIYEFKRKHGGFDIQLALRHTFNKVELAQVKPAECPSCVMPSNLAISVNGQKVNGLTFYDSTVNSTPVITWESGGSQIGETYTIRIHRKTPSTDSLVYSQSGLVARELQWPAELKTTQLNQSTYYYVTVHAERDNKCGHCVSEVATTSLGYEKILHDTTVVKVPPTVQCKVTYYTFKRGKERDIVKYGKSVGCVGCICPVDTITTRPMVRVTLGEDYLSDCPENFKPTQVPAHVKIPSWGRNLTIVVERSVQVGTSGTPIKDQKTYKGTAQANGFITIQPEKKKKGRR